MKNIFENKRHTANCALLGALLAMLTAADAQQSNVHAPAIEGLTAKDVSYAQEFKLPDLESAYISGAPEDLHDGIPVGALGDKQAILAFAREIEAGEHGEMDSLLLVHRGKLIFEAYYRRGRINYPHYAMSITKSLTALAIGRAIQLGHLTMADLDKPVAGFLKNIDQSKLAPGATAITLAEAMNMRSGIRVPEESQKQLLKHTPELKGQGQIQAYMEKSAPIPDSPRQFKYQEVDPAMTMQVVDVIVPGGARAFIEKELLGRIGITNFAWEQDVSGLPKAAAGSALRSRDMAKLGLFMMNEGNWKGEQLIPKAFIEKATERMFTNPQNDSYGYFWWRHDMKVGDKVYDCKSGRGAGGQYIFMLKELDLMVVFTAHHKGMGPALKVTPERILPAFISH